MGEQGVSGALAAIVCLPILRAFSFLISLTSVPFIRHYDVPI
jgi:hypothetical protein